MQFNDFKQDVFAVCGALMPITIQILRFNSEQIATGFGDLALIGVFFKCLALAYVGIFYNRVFCNDTDNRKAFINGMSAPSIMLAVIEPLTNF